MVLLQIYLSTIVSDHNRGVLVEVLFARRDTLIYPPHPLLCRLPFYVQTVVLLYFMCRGSDRALELYILLALLYCTVVGDHSHGILFIL